MVINDQKMIAIHQTVDVQIPIGADVTCADGKCGKSTCVLINPITEKVTHLVVKEPSLQRPEVIVPVEKIVASTIDSIQLGCTRDELQHMDAFVQTHYIHELMPQPAYSGGYVVGSYLVWPYAVRDAMMWVPVSEVQIPFGELAIRRGTRVEATDGAVGHVDEFLVNAATDSITHLVMREGHLWGKKDVSIPVSAIRSTDEDAVHLTLNKQEIEALESISIHHPGSPKQGRPVPMISPVA